MICENCGNPSRETTCPYCGEIHSVEAITRRRSKLHTVNVKEGLPTVDEAWERFLNAYNQTILEGAPLLLIVHGYGSGGEGGAIKREVRRRLAAWHSVGKLRAIHEGESFVLTREWEKRAPRLARQFGGSGNEGVTLVEV